MKFRYSWQEVEVPPRLELVDRVCKNSVALVVFDPETQTWEWTRYTTPTLHGAPAASGSTSQGPSEAMRQVLEGLRDA
ncbi:hypothetical protein ETAA8_15330 [Anatilimnocola aggregata]|uniref:Uncharacterized protein n=1 Tax=Anatilimnocola aggregata TaxID=2528021 RepID=A0A517Y8D9_9BACT|nr:hypothetical protein [Anatilimnocola aggregata]QDU26455.1 hypothetical protein ETAA8_15330 [Anatilimnocola aggregata]